MRSVKLSTVLAAPGNLARYSIDMCARLKARLQAKLTHQAFPFDGFIAYFDFPDPKGILRKRGQLFFLDGRALRPISFKQSLEIYVHLSMQRQADLNVSETFDSAARAEWRKSISAPRRNEDS